MKKYAVSFALALLPVSVYAVAGGTAAATPAFTFGPRVVGVGGARISLTGTGFGPEWVPATTSITLVDTASGARFVLGNDDAAIGFFQGQMFGDIFPPTTIGPGTYDIVIRDEATPQDALNLGGLLTIAAVPVFNFGPALVDAGTDIIFIGSGFSASGSATVTLIDGVGDRRAIGSIGVSADGGTFDSITIPDLTIPARYDVEVRDDISGEVGINTTGPLTVSASPFFFFTPTATTLGGSVRVTGSRFAPNSAAVRVLLRNQDGVFSELGTSMLGPTTTGLRWFSKTFPLAPPIEPGVYSVFVRDLTTGEFAANLSGLLTVAAPAAPDLVLTSVSDPPETVVTCPVCPATFDMTATTANIGLSTSGVTLVTYFLSLDQRRSASDLPIGSHELSSLAAGGTCTDTITLGVPFANSTVFVLACADVPNVVPESNEGNNCRASRTPMTIIFIPD